MKGRGGVGGWGVEGWQEGRLRFVLEVRFICRTATNLGIAAPAWKDFWIIQIFRHFLMSTFLEDLNRCEINVSSSFSICSALSVSLINVCDVSGSTVDFQKQQNKIIPLHASTLTNIGDKNEK